MDDIGKILDFVSATAQLKKLERFRDQFFWREYPPQERYESVADHSWRLALLVLAIHSKLSSPCNLEKALKMAIVHDVPEVIAGDDSPLGTDGTGKDSHAFNTLAQQKRHAHEQEGADRLFGMLPTTIAVELLDIWLEFEEQVSFESRVVKSLDHLEAVIQVLEYTQGVMFPAHLEFNLKYGLKGSDVDPAIEQLGTEIAQRTSSAYQEFIAPSPKR